MNKKRKKCEKEIRQFHKQWIAEFVAKVLEIEYKTYGNSVCSSYKSIYNKLIDSFIYGEDELKEIYQQVDEVLTKRYNFIIANMAFDEEHIYLVELEKESE